MHETIYLNSYNANEGKILRNF